MKANILTLCGLVFPGAKLNRSLRTLTVRGISAFFWFRRAANFILTAVAFWSAGFCGRLIRCWVACCSWWRLRPWMMASKSGLSAHGIVTEWVHNAMEGIPNQKEPYHLKGVWVGRYMPMKNKHTCNACLDTLVTKIVLQERVDVTTTMAILCVLTTRISKICWKLEGLLTLIDSISVWEDAAELCLHFEHWDNVRRGNSVEQPEQMGIRNDDEWSHRNQ